MKLFKNIKTAHDYYKFPGSHRQGSIFVENQGIIRSYSNGLNGDYFDNQNKLFYYRMKNTILVNKFKINIINKTKLRLFVKVKNGVIDMGLFKVLKLTNKYACLSKK